MNGQEKGMVSKDDKSRFFLRLKLGLKKTRGSLASGVMRVVNGSTKFGPELWEELEEVLLASDIGVPTMTWVMEELKKEVRESTVVKKEEIVQLLKELLFNALEEVQVETRYPLEGPCVVMMIGVTPLGLCFLIVGVTQVVISQHGVLGWRILRSKYLTGPKRVLMIY